MVNSCAICLATGGVGLGISADGVQWLVINNEQKSNNGFMGVSNIGFDVVVGLELYQFKRTCIGLFHFHCPEFVNQTRSGRGWS